MILQDRLQQMRNRVRENTMDEVAKGRDDLQKLFGDTVNDIHVLSTVSPVQVEGTINGKRWYFRARGEGWFLRVEQDPRVRDDFIISDTYQALQKMAASTMPLDKAFQCIANGLTKFVREQSPITDDQVLSPNRSSLPQNTHVSCFALIDLAQQVMFLPNAVRLASPNQFLAWLQQYGLVISERQDLYTFRGTTGIITRFRLSQEDGFYLIGHKEQKIW